MDNLKGVDKAIQAAGGQTALAEKLNATPEAKKRRRHFRQQNVWKWKDTGHVPTPWAIPVERITGVSRHELNPDAYPRHAA